MANTQNNFPIAFCNMGTWRINIYAMNGDKIQVGNSFGNTRRSWCKIRLEPMTGRQYFTHHRMKVYLDCCTRC